MPPLRQMMLDLGLSEELIEKLGATDEPRQMTLEEKLDADWEPVAYYAAPLRRKGRRP